MTKTLLIDDNSNAIQVMRPSSKQQVTSGGQSSAFSVASVVYIASDTALNIAVGTNPTADSTDMYIPAGVPTYIKVNAGDKVSVLGATVNVITME